MAAAVRTISAIRRDSRGGSWSADCPISSFGSCPCFFFGDRRNFTSWRAMEAPERDPKKLPPTFDVSALPWTWLSILRISPHNRLGEGATAEEEHAMRWRAAFLLLGLIGPASLTGCANARYLQVDHDTGVIAMPENTNCWPTYYRDHALALMRQQCPNGYEVVHEEESVVGQVAHTHTETESRPPPRSASAASRPWPSPWATRKRRPAKPRTTRTSPSGESTIGPRRPVRPPHPHHARRPAAWPSLLHTSWRVELAGEIFHDVHFL